MFLGLQPAAQFPGEGGLARALQAGEHDHRRWLLGEPDGADLATQDADEFLVDDLDDLLRGVEGAADLGSCAAFLDRRDELLDHIEVDVRFEQGDTDLAHGGVDVGLAEAPLGPEALEQIC